MQEVTTAELAAKLIAVEEGFRTHAYQDKGGVWTIGMGHTRGVHAGQVVTMDEAVQLLVADMAEPLRLVADRPVLEAAALASFTYNEGAGNLALLLRDITKIREYDHQRINGVMVQQGGLTARRALEDVLIRLSRQLVAK